MLDTVFVKIPISQPSRHSSGSAAPSSQTTYSLLLAIVLIEEKKKKVRAAHCFRSAMLLPIHLKGDLKESKEMAKWDFCHSGQCKGVQQGKPTLGKQAGSSGVI